MTPQTSRGRLSEGRPGTGAGLANIFASMAELIQQYEKRILTSEGGVYHAQSWARQRNDGFWEGWLEFHPLDDAARVRRTEIETRQLNKGDLSFWASGLESVYLEGAFARAN